MASVQIRVPEATRDTLQRLADERDQSISVVVEEIVNQYRRDQFWSTFHEQLAVLRSDPVVWGKMTDELAEFDGTLMDGLQDEGIPR